MNNVFLRMSQGLLLAMLLGQTSYSQEVSNATYRVMHTRIFDQPLIWVGRATPEEADSEALWGAIQSISKNEGEPQLASLEQFITVNTNSAWQPCLRAYLAKYYREHGRYTLALEHWEAVWQTTKAAGDGPEKKIADFTFAHWTRLLASLGRKETLAALFTETRNRTFDAGPLQQIIGATKEGYTMMVSDPSRSYKCGTYALWNVSQALAKPASDRNEWLKIPSPANGFTLTALGEVAGQFQLGLAPARRPADNRELLVPSVVHWKQNHYAAIVERKGDRYRVTDPTFEKALWLSAETINAEASGYFMALSDKIPVSWKSLSLAETDLVRGKGYPNNYGGGGGCPCECPPPCPPGSSGTPGSSTGGNGNGSGPGGGCGGAGCRAPSSGSGGDSGMSRGMPVWRVSEPYIDLWIHDEPWGYQPGKGAQVDLKLSYKQRETRVVTTDVFSLGPFWNFNLLSYVEDDTGNDSAITTMPGGGLWTFNPDGTSVEYHSNSTMERLTNGGGGLTGFMMYKPDGSRIKYGLVVAGILANSQAFMTEMITANGQTNRYLYTTNSNIIKLTKIFDANGFTNTISYDTTFTSQIGQLTDPYSRVTTLAYDASGNLTNIIDVAGISSSFKYDANGWITNLITPYGTTVFKFTETNDVAAGVEAGGDNWLNRTAEVTLPDGGRYLYIYRDASEYLDSTHTVEFLTFAYPDNYVPTGTPLGQIDNGFQYYRNSFHWGPKQYAALSTTNFNNFTTNDYNYATLKNWLHEQYDGGPNRVSDTLNMVREPSVDGATLGQMTWYDYDGKSDSGHAGTQKLPAVEARVLPDASTWYRWYTRNAHGLPTQVVETYSSEGEIATRTSTFDYDANGIDLIQAIGFDGSTNLYSYDGNHQVLLWTNAVGYVTRYTYDTGGRVTSVKTPGGLTTTNRYGPDGYLTNTVDLEIARTNNFTYANGLVAARTDERGLIMTNFWDALQRLVGWADSSGSVTNLYSNTSRPLDMVASRDRLNNWTLFEYDVMRRLTAVTNALNRVTRHTYCACGSLETTTDALNNVTSYEYDAKGRRTRTIFPDNSYVSNYFDLMDRVVYTKDASGNAVTNYYNHQGLVAAVSNYFGQVVTNAYDIDDRVTNMVNGAGVNVKQTYDNLGRILTRTYPDTGVEQFFYTTNGLVAYTNQLGKVTRYLYDAAQRKTVETNGNAEVTSFSYNAAGDLLTLTDGKSQATTWGYDVFGRVTSKTNAASTEIFRYLYDANRRLTNRWSAAKTNTYYAYDAVGNLTNVAYPVSTNITLAYDGLNRLTNMTDAAGTSRYTYTSIGQLLTEDGPWDGDTVTYAYNNRQLRQSLSLQQPVASPWEQAYDYDAVKRLTNTTSEAGSFGYTYTPASAVTAPSPLVKKLTLPNTSYITNTYDSVGRLLSTELRNSSHVILNTHAYQVNVGNQREKQTFTATNYVDYTYDDSGQLKSAYGKESGGVTNRLLERLGYAYDAAGNLNYRTNNALVQVYTVNNLNQLATNTRSGTLTVAGTTGGQATNVTVNTSNAVLYADATFASTNHSLVDGTNTFTAIAKDSLGRSDTNLVEIYLPATVTYSYDGNGNLLSDGRRGFDYDDENQLVRVTVTNAWKSEFVYDGKLRRRVTKEFTWIGSAWVKTNEVRYVYDGSLVIQERDGNNTPMVSYTRGKDLSGSMQGAGGIGGLLARSDSTTSYYHADGNGNITALVNTNQYLVARYLYDPYGNTLSMSGDLAEANLYRFSSKEYHDRSGLYYYLYRYYDASLQRWLNGDPIENYGFNTVRGTRTSSDFDGGPDAGNLFAFVNNSPINKGDYFGLIAKPFLPPDPSPPGDPSSPTKCGDFTNKECRVACDDAFGAKNSSIQICYKICASLKGKTCNQLFSYCGHIARHGDFGSQGGKLCYGLYDVICAGK